MLGKCLVTKSPKVNIELGKVGLYILWRFLLFCQTFMGKIVDYESNVKAKKIVNYAFQNSVMRY